MKVQLHNELAESLSGHENVPVKDTQGTTGLGPSGKIRVSMQTLGCRLNLFESDGILSTLEKSGKYEIVTEDSPADVSIINSCTVTDQADKKNEYLVRKALRTNPNTKVVMTGCFAETDGAKASTIPGVWLVVGNRVKSSLLEKLDNAFLGNFETLEDRTKRPVIQNPFAYGTVLPRGHTRAYLKIQDGCDRRCSYCKIPLARGRGVSRNYQDILDQVEIMQDRGIPEIVITGVNLGWYKNEGMRFSHLVEGILNKLTTTRLRLSSIEPCDVDEILGEMSLHPKFCNFLHVPLQSGSDKILKLMKRTYRSHSFRKRIEAVLKHNPDIFLGTDIILGFPGESDEDFKETIQVCSDLGFANLHAFPFSARRTTPAAEMEQIPASIKKARMSEIQPIRHRLWFDYAKKFIGKKVEGVVEGISAINPPSTNAPAIDPIAINPIEAISDNFLRLQFSGKAQSTDHFLIEEILEFGKLRASIAR